jgi:hypothetical protein
MAPGPDCHQLLPGPDAHAAQLPARQGRQLYRDARFHEGSVALPLCATAHPRYTENANISGPLFLTGQCDRTL